MKTTIEVFKSGTIRKQWHYRVKAGNGEIISSSEGYPKKYNAIRGASKMRDLMHDDVEIKVVTR